MGSADGARLRVVVVGNGMVSHRFLSALSAYPRDSFEVTVLGEEPTPAYDRVHLGEALSGRTVTSLSLASEAWYRENGYTLRLGDPVVNVKLGDRIVETKSGERFPYDRLVLATGSSVAVPPVPVDDGAPVFVLRTVQDAERVRARAGNGRTVVIVGGGLLGLETAATLLHAGLKVTVLERAATLMARQLEPEGAATLQTALRALGLQVRVNATIARIRSREGGAVVEVDGEELPADFVIMATGVRPRDELGRTRGIKRHPDGGFVIDDHLQTSDPRVFAIGECAVLGENRFGTVAPGYAMADALAGLFAGASATFVPPPREMRLKIAGIPVAAAGALSTGTSESVVFEKDGVFRSLVLESGCIQNATAVGAWSEWERVAQAIFAREVVPDDRLRSFCEGKPMWPEAPAPDQLPDSAIVCSCNRVTAGHLRAAIADGCTTMDLLVRRTRASSTCGSCALAVEQIVVALDRTASRRRMAAVAAPPAPKRPALGLAVFASLSLMAAAVVAFGRVLFLPRLPGSTAALDTLWREPLAQQISGYVALGLCASVMALPLRRLWRSSAAKALPWWRSLHAGLGVAATVGLLAHTGVRLGANLNFLLSVGFVGLVVWGGLLSFGHVRLRPPSRLTRALRVAHVGGFWAVMGLLVLHVVAVYFY